MRQALNNLQSTKEGFGLVNSENVFKVIFSILILIKKMFVYKSYSHKNQENLIFVFLTSIPGSFRSVTSLTHSWCETCWTTVSLATSTRRTRRWTTSGSWATPLKTSSPTCFASARITTRWLSTSSSSSSRRSGTVTWESSKAVAHSFRWQHSSPECVKLPKSRRVKPQTNFSSRIFLLKILLDLKTVKIYFNALFFTFQNSFFLINDLYWCLLCVPDSNPCKELRLK